MASPTKKADGLNRRQIPLLIAIFTLDGFNEIDSFVALNDLTRVKQPNWRAALCAPTGSVTSMNGAEVRPPASLLQLSVADVVIFESGVHTLSHTQDAELMAQLKVDPTRQLVAGQCSGTQFLAKLGLLVGIPACTDLKSNAWVFEAGVEVIDDRSLRAATDALH